MSILPPISRLFDDLLDSHFDLYDLLDPMDPTLDSDLDSDRSETPDSDLLETLFLTSRKPRFLPFPDIPDSGIPARSRDPGIWPPPPPIDHFLSAVVAF